MDPQETWRRLLDAWVKREWEDVEEIANALLDWLEKGGFPPEVEYPKELGVDFNAILASAACDFARRRAVSVLNNANRIPSDVAFTLICRQCLRDGPDMAADAVDRGWTDIAYVPASISENFLGICPNCRAVTREARLPTR